VARCLIIACGCRGLALARCLRSDGHAVRASTRNAARVPALEAEGIEAVLGDPDRVATLAPALDHVAVAYVLLGSAIGTPEALGALHSTRLDMLLSKILDSTVRGIVYEAAGSVDADVLGGGAARVRAFAQDSRVPYVLLGGDPGDHEAWLTEARAAVEHVLAAPA
jgi:putative NADH-flavin reductase